jgi:hypothetical protein
MTTSGTLPNHILDTLDGKTLPGAIEVTAFSQTVVHEDGCQEVMLALAPTEHVLRIALHKDDLPLVEMKIAGDYLIYEFCGQADELSIAIQPVEPESIRDLKEALAGLVADLSPQDQAPAN